MLFRISSTKASGKSDVKVRSMVSTQLKLNTAGRKNISKIISLLANTILLYLTVLYCLTVIIFNSVILLDRYIFNSAILLDRYIFNSVILLDRCEIGYGSFPFYVDVVLSSITD